MGSGMSDIFISYAREDEQDAKSLAAVLADNGWSVWWDRNIPAGRTFDQIIEEQLQATRCVIVIWSARSVSSQWVRGEAHYAFEQRKLVPVRIDHTEVPFVFRQVQTADLVGWDGDPSHDGLLNLRSSITSLLAGDSGQASSEVTPIPARPRSRLTALIRRRAYFALIPSGLVSAVIAAWFLSSGATVQPPVPDGRRPTATPVPASPTPTRVLPTPERTIDF
jgi:hypothetical protein